MFCNKLSWSFMKKKKKETLENFLLFYLENDHINKLKMKKRISFSISNPKVIQVIRFYLQIQNKFLEHDQQLATSQSAVCYAWFTICIILREKKRGDQKYGIQWQGTRGWNFQQPKHTREIWNRSNFMKSLLLIM